MNRLLLDLLCDPVSRAPLALVDEACDESGSIVSGTLVSPDGRRWPIINGIPRFVEQSIQRTVTSFGDQWNFFNFTDFKEHWLRHTVSHTFGSTEAFRGKLIVDSGAGAGAQTLWMLESGAKHVIALELSSSVDEVMQRNLSASGFKNYDIIQCSIDAPPLRDGSIGGIVICHNVIQHTPSVEATAHALWKTVGPGGELVFNCYVRNDLGAVRWLRHHVVSAGLRGVLRRAPFGVNLAYAYTMGAVRLVPGLGLFVEKSGFCSQGDVPRTGGPLHHLRHRFRATALNTFDAFGSHKYQHYKSNTEIRDLVRALQPDEDKIRNSNEYFARPPPIGIALRVQR